MVSRIQRALVPDRRRQILRSLNSRGVTPKRRPAFSCEGVFRSHDKGSGRSVPGWSRILHLRTESGLAEQDIWDEVRRCVALARRTQTVVESGERLNAARTAVELVRAYDRVLEQIRLVPLSLPEQQRVRDQLSPVAELLRKYRFR